MIISVCSVCRQVYGWKDLTTPGFEYSHGYCPRCHAAAMQQIDDDFERWAADESERRETDNKLCGFVEVPN